MQTNAADRIDSINANFKSNITPHKKIFNDLYLAYKQNSSILSIYKLQYKYNNFKSNFIDFTLKTWLIVSAIVYAILTFHHIVNLYIDICMLSILIFFIISDIKHLKNATSALASKQNIPLTFPSMIDQFRYYVWRNAISNSILSFSAVVTALSYFDIEFYPFESKKNYDKGFMIFILTIIVNTFWHLFDDLHLQNITKLLVEFFIIYICYKIITLKNIFPTQEKELLTFKQFLMRLKFELE